MTNQDKLELVKQKVGEAIELRYCICCGGEHAHDLFQLADVLRAISEVELASIGGIAYDGSITNRGYFIGAVSEYGDAQSKIPWDLTKDLDSQTPEVIDFLYNLLS